MEVIWSSKAKNTYFRVLDYLDKNWSQKEIIKFHHRTEAILKIIKKNPGLFPFSAKQKNIRKPTLIKTIHCFTTLILKMKE